MSASEAAAHPGDGKDLRPTRRLPDLQSIRRITIVGCSGAGKSTLAKRLGAWLGRDVIHLDSLFWEPGWQEASTETFRERVARAVQPEAWITDGSLGRVADLVLPSTELVLWVETPRWLCAARVLWRWVTHWGRSRADMGPGCPERFDRELMGFIWNFDRDGRQKLDERLAQYGYDVPILRVSSFISLTR
jgi:adenylate kinase family enzyme